MGFGTSSFNIIDLERVTGLIYLFISVGDGFYISRETEVAS
jgi:hypothetical protein